jgi:putative glutamine amidotransferase
MIKEIEVGALRPVIGLSSALSAETRGYTSDNGGFEYVGTPYNWSIYKCGGVPIMLVPPIEDEEYINERLAENLLNRVNGLVLTGGGEARRFTPYGMTKLSQQQPLRYKFETLLIKEAWHRNMPVLAICRGYQTVTEVLGGTIKEQLTGRHRQNLPGTDTWHSIDIINGTKLHRLTGVDWWDVNSFHYQVVENPPDGFTVSAVSEDGVIEAIEADDRLFFIGVQFHPEMLLPVDPIAKRLFAGFIEAASSYK